MKEGLEKGRIITGIILLIVFLIVVVLLIIKTAPLITEVNEVKWCADVAREDYNFTDPICEGDELRAFVTKSSGTYCYCYEKLDNLCVNLVETENSIRCKEYKYSYLDTEYFKVMTAVFFNIK